MPNFECEQARFKMPRGFEDTQRLWSGRICLASASPRRAELLKCLFDSFKVCPSNADECTILRRPAKTVMENAKRKAFALDLDGALILSADTLVYMDGNYFLKPKSEQDAALMLRRLSGRTHFVYSGVCLRAGENAAHFYDKSAVTFKRLTDEQIKDYILSGSPMDKAGAYGIQDGAVVKCYRGSYSNIMGLPLEKLTEVLSAFGCGR